MAHLIIGVVVGPFAGLLDTDGRIDRGRTRSVRDLPVALEVSTDH
jgi:hypothetical protein